MHWDESHITRMSKEEHFQAELTSESRHDFYRGEAFELPPASASHCRVKIQFLTLLDRETEGKQWTLYGSDLRLLVQSQGFYVYPDYSMVCDKPQIDKRVCDSLLNPQVLVEVLSPETERYDRGRKLAFYREIPSLRRYVLISQPEQHVELFTRRDEGGWMLEDIDGPNGAIRLPELNSEVPLRDLYADLPEPASDGNESTFERLPRRLPGDVSCGSR